MKQARLTMRPTKVKSMPKAVDHCWSCVDLAERSVWLSTQIAEMIRFAKIDDLTTETAEVLAQEGRALLAEVTRLHNDWTHG